MLCCCFVTYLRREGFTLKMLFEPEDGQDLSSIIRRRRPRWAHSAIMEQLGIAAKAGASLSQVMAAAEKAMNNQKHMTPAAIMFPENWEQTNTKTAGNIAAPRVCMECTQRFPADQVSRHPSGHGFICGSCGEVA